MRVYQFIPFSICLLISASLLAAPKQKPIKGQPLRDIPFLLNSPYGHYPKDTFNHLNIKATMQMEEISNQFEFTVNLVGKDRYSRAILKIYGDSCSGPLTGHVQTYKSGDYTYTDFKEIISPANPFLIDISFIKKKKGKYVYLMLLNGEKKHVSLSFKIALFDLRSSGAAMRIEELNYKK